MEYLNNSVKIRSRTRIFFLLCIIIFIIAGFNNMRISNLEKKEFNFKEGQIINIQTTSCMIHVYDSGTSDLLSPYAPNPLDSTEDGKLTFAVGPGLIIGKGSSYSFDDNLN